MDPLSLAWSIVYNVGIAAFMAYAVFRFVTGRRVAPTLVPILAIIGAYALAYGEIPFTGIKFPWQSALEVAKGTLDTSIAQVQEAYKTFGVMATEAGGARLAADLAATIARGAIVASNVFLGEVSLPLKVVMALTTLGDYLAGLIFDVYNAAFELLGQAGFVLYFLRAVLDAWPIFVLAGAAITAINIDEESVVAAGLGIMYLPALLAIAISVMPPLVLNAQSLGQPVYTGLLYYDDGGYLLALVLQSADGKRAAALYQDVAALPVTSLSSTDYVVKEFAWAGISVWGVNWRIEWVRGSLTNSTPPPPSNITTEVNVPVHVPAVLVNYTNLTPSGNHSPLVRVLSVKHLFCGRLANPSVEPAETCRGWVPVQFLGWTDAWVPQVDISLYSVSASSTVNAYKWGTSSWYEGTVSWSCSGYADECTLVVDLNPLAAPKLEIDPNSLQIEHSEYVGSVSLNIRDYTWLGGGAVLFNKVWSDLKSRNFTLEAPNNDLGDLGTTIRSHLRAAQNYTWAGVRQGRLVLYVTAEPKIQCEQQGNQTVCYEVPTDRWVRIKWKSVQSPFSPPPPQFAWIAPPPYEEFNKSLSMLVASAALVGDRRLGNYNALPALTSQGLASWLLSQFKPPTTMDFQPPKPSYGPFAAPQSLGGCTVNPSYIMQFIPGYSLAVLFGMIIQPACDVVAKVSTWFASLWWDVLTVFALATVFSALAGSASRPLLGKMMGKMASLAKGLAQPRPPMRLPNPVPVAISAVGHAQSRLAALAPMSRAASAARYALMGLGFGLKFLEAANLHAVQALTRAVFGASRFADWVARHLPRPPGQLPERLYLYYHRLAAAGYQRVADAVFAVGAALYTSGAFALKGLAAAFSAVGSVHTRLAKYEALINAVADVTGNMRINPILRQVSAKVAEAYYYLSAAYGRRAAAVWIATHPHSLRPSVEEVLAFFIGKMPSLTPPVVRVDYERLAKLLGLSSPDAAARAYLSARAFALGIHREFHPDVAVKMAERGWGAGHPAVDAYLRGGREVGYVAFDAAYKWPLVATSATQLGAAQLLKAAQVAVNAVKLGAVKDPADVVYLWARGPYVADPHAATTAWSLLERAPHLLSKLPGFEFLETTARYPLRVLAADLPDFRLIAHSPIVVWRFAPTEELAFLAALHVKAGDANAGPWGGRPVDWASEIARHYAVQPADRLEHLLASVRGGVAESVRYVLAAAKAGGTVPTLAVDPQYPIAAMVAARLAEAYLPEEGAAARAWVKMVTHGYRVSLGEVKSMLFEPPPVVDAATAELYRLSARYIAEGVERLAKNYGYTPEVFADWNKVKTSISQLVAAEKDERTRTLLEAYIALGEGRVADAFALAPKIVQTDSGRLAKAWETLKSEAGITNTFQVLWIEPAKLSEEGRRAYEEVRRFVEGVVHETERYVGSRMPELQLVSPEEVRAAREFGRLWIADYALALSPMADALRYLPPMEEARPAPKPPAVEEVPTAVVPFAELRTLAEAVAALSVQTDVWKVWRTWESEGYATFHGVGPYADDAARSLGSFWSYVEPPPPPPPPPQPYVVTQTEVTPPPQPHTTAQTQVPQPPPIPEPSKPQLPEELRLLEQAANLPAKTAEDERGQAYLRAYIALAEGNFEEAVRQAAHVLPPDVVEGTPVPGETYLEKLVRAWETLSREAGTANAVQAIRADPGKLSDEGKAALEAVKSFVNKVEREAERYFRRKIPDKEFPRII